VVFLHGFSLDHRQWAPQVPFFAPLYRVILPDARGHGLSEASKTGYSRNHRVQDLSQLVDILKIEKFHLVGLSMGGATAIGYALKHQERLKSLTLVSTSAAGYSVGKKFSRLDDLAKSEGVDAALKKWMDWGLAWYKDDLREIGETLKQMMTEYSGAVWADPMRGKYPRSDDLQNVHAINVPTQILAGELDRMFVPLAKMLHKQIADSRLTLYENTGHMINLEAPKRFNADLGKFLREVEG